jgi:dihydrofolate reductase
MEQHPRISIVAAIGTKTLALGKGNELLWHLPEDLKRFKELTSGHAIIMGRKTFDSILAVLKKPLPNRTSIVVTRDPAWQYEGAIAATSIEDAITKAKEIEKEEIFIGGGAQIYELALPHTDRLYLTLIDDEGAEADVFFPAYADEFTEIIEEIEGPPGAPHYRWVTLEKEK